MEFEYVKRDTKGINWLADNGVKEVRRHWYLSPPVPRSGEGRSGQWAMTGHILPITGWNMYVKFNQTDLTWEVRGSFANPRQSGTCSTKAELYQKCVSLLETLEDEWLAQVDEKWQPSYQQSILNMK